MTSRRYATRGKGGARLMLSYKPQGGDFRPLGAVEWVNSLDGKRHQIELTNEKNEEDFTVCFLFELMIKKYFT